MCDATRAGDWDGLERRAFPGVVLPIPPIAPYRADLDYMPEVKGDPRLSNVIHPSLIDDLWRWLRRLARVAGAGSGD